MYKSPRRPAIDLDRQISLTAASHLPQVMRDGKSPNLATVWRWATKGIRHGGRRVYLETTCVGGRRLTTPAAVERFIAALTAPADQQPAPAKVVSAHRKAELELEAAGI